MGTNKKWIFAVLLAVALIQLACSIPLFPGESINEREEVACELTGGIWRVEVVDGDLERWCEEATPVSGNPTPTIHEIVVTESTATQTAAPFDISQCDASTAVNVAPLLTEETFNPGSRWCSYTQTTTNISDQEVMFFYHSLRNTQEPSWVSVLLSPAQVHTFLGYLQDTDYGGLTYMYIDQVAAIYYTEACQEAIHFSDTAAAAELFAMEAAHYCSP